VDVCVDGMKRSVPPDVSAAHLLAEIEAGLLREGRLVERVVVGDRTFWSVEEAKGAAEAAKDAPGGVEVYSRTFEEFARDVCASGAEYIGRLVPALKECAALWKDGMVQEAAALWSAAVDGFKWLTTAGAQVAHLTNDEAWAPALARLHEALIPIERSLAERDFVQLGDLVQSKLVSGVENMAGWFSARAALK